MTLRRISGCILGAAIFVGEGVFAAVQVDFPEKETESHRMEGGYDIVETTGFAGQNFFYVFRGGKRIWKSPPVRVYFSVSGGAENRDVDGDGVSDIVLSGGEPKFHCGNFGVVVVLRNKENSYLVHYDSSMSADSAPKGLMEFSETPPPEIKAGILEIMEGLACPPDKEDVAKIIEQESYSVIPSAEERYPELRNVHKKAMTAHMSGNAGQAAALMDTFFFAYDYREVDAGNRNPEYTTTLNDYGVFIQQLKSQRPFFQEQAEEILSYVVLRDSSRAVAYLNLADVQYGSAERRSQASKNYRTYFDLMTKNGKQKLIPERVLKRMNAGKR